MATAAGSTTSSAESEALKLAFGYLSSSIDASSLLSDAFSSNLIRDRQRTDCVNEDDPYKKAEKFLGYLQREVNGDSNKFHTFVPLLEKTGHVELASRLRDELSNATRSMQDTSSTTEVIVPDELVDELASLRLGYASFLHKYKKQLQNCSEAQEEFVETLPGLLHRKLSSERNFQSYFDTLVEEETSLFNITYLKHFCNLFPEDVCATTTQLVVKYVEKRQHFMTGVTVNQFKKMFPASAAPSRLSTEKMCVTLKLENYWGENTLDDLTKLVSLFGVSGERLHLAIAKPGCILVLWLCSTADAKELKIAIAEAADSLHTKGVLEISIGKELVLEFPQSDQVNEARMYAFVDEPDSDYFCSVCQDLLTEPFQPDCGHHLCRKCRDRLLSTNSLECPTCRESNALNEAHFDRYFQRKVNSIKVYCQHHKKGCEWVGEVRYLQDHLAHCEGNCIYSCPYGCGKYSWKAGRSEHKKLHCPNRPIRCKNCDYYNKFTIVTEKHYPICPQSKVDCPDQVKKVRREILNHYLTEFIHPIKSPNTSCSIQLPREGIKLQTHQQHNQVLEETNQLVAINPPTEVSQQYLYNQPPLELVISDIHNPDRMRLTPSFLTHRNGYKFYLTVYPKGSGKATGTHISVFLTLLKGEYDNDLGWPFEGYFVIELLNWRADKNHYLTTITLDRYTDPNGSHTSRVYKEFPFVEYGKFRFISHSSLFYNPDANTEYLQDDCLRLRVVDVVVYSTPLLSKTPSWQDPHTATQSVCDFTLTEFTKRKQFDNNYNSPPFYSHPHGYKLSLRVDAYGDGKAKGTHTTIGAYLMKGDFDKNLQWPFEGDIVVELLNWRENDHHYRGNTICFGRYLDPYAVCSNHVLDAEYAPIPLGIPHFIPHSSLLYNPDTNTEYLQNDCLRLRVVDVAVYSTPLHSKTPSWQDPHTVTQSVCDFTLTEFTKRKQFNNAYCSPPFYSHSHGYKLCIKVYANGYGEGKDTHISIFAYLMRGDYDNSLQWPFECDIVIEVLNWKEDNYHYRGDTISLNNHTHPDGIYTNRVTEGEYAGSSWGDDLFSHSLLYNPDTNTEYLQDDCLRLRVVDVAVYSTPLLSKTPSWQDPHTATQSACAFTLAEFTKRKQFNNNCYSPPFYSHTNGYKMLLKVCVNGCRNAKGTRVSVYVSLLKGEYDSNLDWPFKGVVIVELTNWKNNKDHLSHTIVFNEQTDPVCSSRVTEQYLTDIGWNGSDDAFPHSSLLYNPVTNTEYLHDDCLQFRVREVRVNK